MDIRESKSPAILELENKQSAITSSRSIGTLTSTHWANSPQSSSAPNSTSKLSNSPISMLSIPNSPKVPKHDLLRGLVKTFVDTTLGGSVSPFVAFLSESGPVSEHDPDHVPTDLISVRRHDRQPKSRPNCPMLQALLSARSPSFVQHYLIVRNFLIRFFAYVPKLRITCHGVVVGR